MHQLLLVGIGGFFGAIARYGTKELTALLFVTAFPLGTLVVNVVGSLLLGIGATVAYESEWLSHHAQLLLFSGLLASFTTFSSFSVESLQLLEQGRSDLFILYAGGSVSLCLLGAWFGFTVTRLFIP